MKGPLPIAKLRIDFYESSHVVRYNFFILSGIIFIFWIEPLLAKIWSLTSFDHKLSFIKSLHMCLLIQINSPDKTLLEYMLLVNASNVSLFPNIYEVLAVGIGANNKEFLIPCFLISCFKASHSYILALWFHKSNYNNPFEAGEPLKLS